MCHILRIFIHFLKDFKILLFDLDTFTFEVVSFALFFFLPASELGPERWPLVDILSAAICCGFILGLDQL